MEKKAFIYARTSPGAGTEVGEQLEACREYCKRKGYKIIGEYQDNGYSGRTYPVGCDYAAYDQTFQDYAMSMIKNKSQLARPGLADLLATLKTADVIVASDWHRISRAPAESMLNRWLYHQFNDADVEIDTVSDGMFSLRDYLIDQTSSLLKNSQGNLNIKKSQAATREIRDRGLLSYSPNFYGFRSAGRSRVTPVADELATVREIFDAYLSGETLAGIARDLNSRGVATFTGKSQWTGAKIRKILTRPQYAGLHPDSSQQLIAAKPFEPHSVVFAVEFHQAQRKL